MELTYRLNNRFYTGSVSPISININGQKISAFIPTEYSSLWPVEFRNGYYPLLYSDGEPLMAYYTYVEKPGCVIDEDLNELLFDKEKNEVPHLVTYTVKTGKKSSGFGYTFHRYFIKLSPKVKRKRRSNYFPVPNKSIRKSDDIQRGIYALSSIGKIIPMSKANKLCKGFVVINGNNKFVVSKRELLEGDDYLGCNGWSRPNSKQLSFIKRFKEEFCSADSIIRYEVIGPYNGLSNLANDEYMERYIGKLEERLQKIPHAFTRFLPLSDFLKVHPL